MFFTAPGLPNYAETVLRGRVQHAEAMRRDGERGASAIEWVIISAVLILIVGAVGGVLWDQIANKADCLELTTPTRGGTPSNGCE